MIGGPSGTHAYTQCHWDKIVELARTISARRSVAIFSSRRTPPKIVAELKLLKNAKTAIFDDKEALTPEMFEYCKRSQAIVVTEDSNSMITEAICCRKPVLVLAPSQNAMNADENAHLQELADNGWAVTFGARRSGHVRQDAGEAEFSAAVGIQPPGYAC